MKECEMAAQNFDVLSKSQLNAAALPNWMSILNKE